MTQQNMPFDAPLAAGVSPNPDNDTDPDRYTESERDNALAGASLENPDVQNSADADRAASYDTDRSDAARVNEHADRGDLADTSTTAPSPADYAARGDMADTSDARDGAYDDNRGGVDAYSGGRTSGDGVRGGGTTGQGEPGLVHDLNDPEMPDVIPLEVTERAAQAQGVTDASQQGAGFDPRGGSAGTGQL